MDIHQLSAYEIIEEREISDVRSQGYVLRHKKSGARVVILSNEDDNKVFYIGFRTPPKDETGVPHIIEHSTLCGSEKFPVKDPFAELVKGSLNTFLNAMTYPDKTVYPLASYHTKDFENLMDVYLDAVFHPNITKYKEIFQQEGWHFELESADAPLTINGVVYNEMKGAYSSPDEILQDQISKSLYPDSPYSRSYGGNPQYIPELTYEDYLEFYQKYYHPSNAYIYLYGDMDVAERLEWMDQEYLCHYDVLEVDSGIPLQKGFDKMAEAVTQYPVASDETEEDRTYLSYNKVVGTVLDPMLYQAFDILDYALVSAPGAPIRQALIDAGIGQDVYGYFNSGILQPEFSIVAKNANVSDKDRFQKIVEKELHRAVKEGVNRNSLLAGISSLEFRIREADYGHYPKGLLYGLQCLESWLYDDTRPFLHLECLDTLALLKDKAGSGYFEELIQTFLLDNTHGSIVVIEPKKGLNQQEEDDLKKQLEERKSRLSPKEIEELVKQTAHLKAYQEEPSPAEDLEKIPLLTRKDMKREAAPFSNIEEKIGGTLVVRHDFPTNGIDYITLMFEAGDIAAEDIPLLGILRNILGYVNTEHYTYLELANAVNIYTGGISGGVSCYPDVNDPEKMTVKCEVSIKVLEDHIQEAMELVNEILLTSDLEDEKRLGEILAQTKSRLQISLSSSGHIVAAYRALSHFSRYAYYQDRLRGISFYQRVAKFEEEMEHSPKALIQKLQELVRRLFTRNRLMVSFTAEQAAYEKAVPVLEQAFDRLFEDSPVGEPPALKQEPVCEAFTDASQIQYVARVGNFRKHGFSYHGYLRILKLILEYDFMWMNIRVVGGAYGCLATFMRTGEAYFVSYRDPNLRRTNEIYESIPEYLENFDPDERDMTKYIIGTFGSMDTPLYPEGKGSRSMTSYLQGITIERIQQARDEILHAEPEDIRGLADLIRSVLEDDQICVIGNESAIREEEDMFTHIQGLYESEKKNDQ